MALNAHPEWAALEAEAVARDAQRQTIGRWGHPELDIDIGRRTARRESESGWDYSIAFMQPIPAPGKIGARAAWAAKGVEEAEHRRAWFARSLEAQIVAGVHAWWAHRDYADALTAQSERMASALDGYLRRAPAGAIQRMEQALVESSLLDIRKSAAQARYAADRTLADLNTLLGRAPDTPLEDLAAPPPPSTDTSRHPDFDRHPLVRTHHAEWERRRLDARQVELDARPDIAAGPFYSRERAGDEDDYTIGLAVSVPLPLWNRTRGDAAVAAAEAEQARAAKEMARRDLDALWHEAIRRIRLNDDLLAIYSETRVAGLRDAADRAAQQFQSGAIDAVLFLEIQREYLSAAADRQQARVERLGALHQLQSLTVHEEQP